MDPEFARRYTDASLRQRQRIERVVARGGAQRVRDGYQRMNETLYRRTAQVARKRAPAGTPYTVAVHAAVQPAIRVAHLHMGNRLADVTDDLAEEAGVEAIYGLGEFASEFDLPYDVWEDPRETVRADRADRGAIVAAIAALLAADLFAAIDRDLLNAAALGTEASRAMEDAFGSADRRWWMVQRFIQTELARAYNEALASEMAGMTDVYMRWTELIDDETGMRFDDRVADDSVVLHGQITPPNGVFTMPADPLAPPKMVGMGWACPPNRPNDRSVLCPWHTDMPVPAWIYEGGTQRWMNGWIPREYDTTPGVYPGPYRVPTPWTRAA